MGAAQVRFVPTLAGQSHQRGGSQSLERMVRISSMNGPQSLELSVSITGIHNLRMISASVVKTLEILVSRPAAMRTLFPKYDRANP